MTSHPDQYMIYHLVSWNEEKNKWNKKPVSLTGAPLPTESGIPTTANRDVVVQTVNALNGDGPTRYMMGLWLAPESNFFFLDLDDNAVADGRLTPVANSMAEPFIRAGCYFEASTSGRGAHVIGRFHGVLQPHATSRKRVHPHEFFTRDRGVVLNPSAHSGSWDVDATLLLPALLTEHFPPRHAGEQDLFDFHDGPRDTWRGPTDDDELIRKFLTATGSHAARLRGSVSLPDLWNGRCQQTSESDLALASHLAFWTGADAARIERLMRRSPAAAQRLAKWDTHRTYLRDLTIREACVTTKTVYVEPQRVDTAAALLGTNRAPGGLKPLAPPPNPVVVVTAPVVTGLIGGPLGISDAVVLNERTPADWYEAIERGRQLVNSAGTYKELMEDVVPAVRAIQFPPMHGEQVAQAMFKKLEMFDAKQPISKVRALLMPPVEAQLLQAQVKPEWAEPLVYLTASDKFFDTASTTEYTHEACRMVFNRFMPLRNTGNREDAVAWLRDKWDIDTVEDAVYRPDQEATFWHAGKRYANKFLASTMPTLTFPSAECGACIELFQRHLYEVVGRRDAIYWSLLHWLAHNIQYPGRKIRWAPLIKGVQGDGKSIIGDLMFAAMGSANVTITSAATLGNSGGFTDWAVGGCVNVIAEIRLEGKERRRLYNAMKDIIGDNHINPNRKNKASGGVVVNVTNHAAFTNHNDAVPTENGERRWMIVFTPWADADEAARIKGLPSADSLPQFFSRLGDSMRAEPGGWRTWLMGIDLSSFNPDGRAPSTSEREAMRNSSEDYVEQTVIDVIAQGGVGVDKEAFCSSSLMGRVQVVLGEKPDTRKWNRILTDVGYQQAAQVWWNNKTRRIWVKSPKTKDEILEILTRTALSQGF